MAETKVVVTKSKLDNLAQHINTKVGTAEAMTIDEMAATVDSIETRGVLQEKSVDITANGKHDIIPDEGNDSLSKVTVNVNVPATPLNPLSVTANGEYTPAEGAGYGTVTVNVPSKKPALQEKTVTANGDVAPDSGYDGLSKVTVNVPSSGIDTSDATALAEQIVAGATAYVKDKKITGAMPIYSGAVVAQGVAVNGSNVETLTVDGVAVEKITVKGAST